MTRETTKREQKWNLNNEPVSFIFSVFTNPEVCIESLSRRGKNICSNAVITAWGTHYRLHEYCPGYLKDIYFTCSRAGRQLPSFLLHLLSVKTQAMISSSTKAKATHKLSELLVCCFGPLQWQWRTMCLISSICHLYLK